MDRSIKPGDDFYHYANGNWLRAVVIPASQPSYDTQPVRGSVAQKVGAYRVWIW
jgi:predicted metalloendopeptidase